MRSLARTLGLSHTTVSDALRGKGRVDPATVLRVRRAARDAGYKRNPLAAAVMSELRRSRGGTFRGVLAAVDVFEPERSDPHGVFHRELVRGGRARAVELGFKLEQFVVDRTNLTVARLDSIMQSRGIHGVLVLPSWYAPNWSELDWSRYAGVYTDYLIDRPALHCVCCNHYRSTTALLGRLAERGYRRPGLCIEQGRDERTQRRFSAAFRSFQENHPGLEFVPPLIAAKARQDEFARWFRRSDRLDGRLWCPRAANPRFRESQPSLPDAPMCGPRPATGGTRRAGGRVADRATAAQRARCAGVADNHDGPGALGRWPDRAKGAESKPPREMSWGGRRRFPRTWHPAGDTY